MEYEQPNFLQRFGAALQGPEVVAAQRVQGLFADPANAGLPVDQLIRKAAAIDPAYANELIKMEMQKAGYGQSTPAALQLANEVARLEAAGDTAGAQRIREFAKTAPITTEYNKGLFRLPDGSFAPIAGYGDASGFNKAAETTAVKTAEQRVVEGSLDATQTREKAMAAKQAALDVTNRLLKNAEGVEANRGGFSTLFKNVSDTSVNAEADLETLASLLTTENLGLLKGVLSDTDMKILKDIGAGGLKGADAQVLSNLATIQKKLQGQVSAVPAASAGNAAPVVRYNAAGQKATLTNGKWVIE